MELNLGTRLLLIVSERIGDVIFCTPAIDLLHRKLPTTKFSVIAPNAGVAGVFEQNPAIKNVYTAPDEKQLKTLAQEYDAVIDFHNSKLTAEYCAALGLHTYSSPRHKENQHQSMVASEFIAELLQCPTPEPIQYLLYPKHQHFKHVEQKLIKAGVDLNKDILIGCHMGCSQITRRGWKIWKKTTGHKSWPLKNFIELERKLREFNPEIRLVLTGSKGETSLCQKVVAKSKRAIDLSGQTTVLELAALMDYLKVFITGDTGPLHVACSTDKPIVTLFGPTSPTETGPFPPQPYHTVIHKPDMEQITVQEVFDKVKSALTAST